MEVLMTDLNDRITFLGSLAHGRYKQITSKLLGVSRDSKQYFDKPIHNVEEGTDLLKKGVLSQKPFLAGRFGTSECGVWVRNQKMRLLHFPQYGKAQRILCNNAGFFPDDPNKIDQYCDLMYDLLPELNLLCTMNTVGESYIVKKYCPHAQLTLLPVVDPCVNGWTEVLMEKKVLVIHPMADTIQKQYQLKRAGIFPGTEILPEFQLQTLKAVQTIAGNADTRFSDWFQGLEYMFNLAMRKDFEIALVGCGAYGLPLAAKIKREGKTAIHMGGCLQLLFGIFGSRWTNDPNVKRYYNSNWVRPSSSEIPAHCDRVENGCYW
jgi:hypothetical protein